MLSWKVKKRFRFSWNENTKDIVTKHMSRTVQVTVDTKRTVLCDYTATPFGNKPEYLAEKAIINPDVVSH